MAFATAFPTFAQTSKQSTRKKAKTTRVTKKRTTKKKKNTANYSNNSIKGLRNQRAGVQRKIKQQERLLRANKADVKKRLGNLMVLNTEIDKHQKAIDTIQSEITHIDGVDGIFIGPFDLSVALNKPGEFGTQEFKDAIDRILKACKDAGKFAMLYTGDAKSTRAYFEQGFDAAAVSLDTKFYTNAFRSLIKDVREG